MPTHAVDARTVDFGATRRVTKAQRGKTTYV